VGVSLLTKTAFHSLDSQRMYLPICEQAHPHS
jgi:hypothetical protein